MPQLEDLNDDCLTSVLDRLPPKELYKLTGVNKRIRRLAAVKLQFKIKAIQLSMWFEGIFKDCDHLGSISDDQILDLSHFWEIVFSDTDPSKRATFFSVLAKCTGVKSIDFPCVLFCSDPLPDGLLLEMVGRCPELECLKLNQPVKEDEWDRVLDQIGSRLIHFVKRGNFGRSFEEPMLAKLVQKCPNIKQLKWTFEFSRLTSNFLTDFKLLPKDCRILLKLSSSIDAFDDIFDELIFIELNWSWLGTQVNRVSSLKFSLFELGDGPVCGVDFAGLKKLDLSDFSLKYSDEFIGCLVASRFPLLEEFYFNASGSFKEDDYETIFNKLASVKKLIINCDDSGIGPQLPKAAIHLLKQLDAVEVQIKKVPTNWKPKKSFFKVIEQYIDGIKSLKKLTVCDSLSVGSDLFGFGVKNDQFKKTVQNEVMKLKQKKQTQVKIVFISNN